MITRIFKAAVPILTATAILAATAMVVTLLTFS